MTDAVYPYFKQMPVTHLKSVGTGAKKKKKKENQFKKEKKSTTFS